MIECNCKNMCVIDAKSTLKGHHINCDRNTEKIELARLCFNGTSSISEIDDALEQLKMLENDDIFTFKKVWMTQNELEELPEFAGW